jgi:hypothetical protein
MKAGAKGGYAPLIAGHACIMQSAPTNRNPSFTEKGAMWLSDDAIQ